MTTCLSARQARKSLSPPPKSMPCICLWLEVLENARGYGITSSQGIYYLEDVRFAFCPFCGGHLPDVNVKLQSVDPAEEASALSCVGHETSFDELVRCLGKPDSLTSYNKFKQGSIVKSFMTICSGKSDQHCLQTWKRHALYSKKWNTLVFEVYERMDGSLSASVTGKLCPVSESSVDAHPKKKIKVSKKNGITHSFLRLFCREEDRKNHPERR